MPSTIVRGPVTANAVVPLVRGQLFDTEVAFANPDGTAMNLTGKTVTARIFDGDWVDMDVEVAFTSMVGGTINLTLSSLLTEDVPEGEASELEVDVIRSDGEVELRFRVAVRGD